jgi:hypothetical protein
VGRPCTTANHPYATRLRSPNLPPLRVLQQRGKCEHDQRIAVQWGTLNVACTLHQWRHLDVTTTTSPLLSSHQKVLPAYTLHTTIQHIKTWIRIISDDCTPDKSHKFLQGAASHKPLLLTSAYSLSQSRPPKPTRFGTCRRVSRQLRVQPKAP